MSAGSPWTRGAAPTAEERSDEADTRPRQRTPAFAMGERIGRYVLRDVLGHGGMGTVYAAYDPELDRDVAIKLLHRSKRDFSHDARLVREAQAMARLSHPNVAKIYEVGRHEQLDERRIESAFIAMELVQGQSLRAWRTEKKRTWPEILDVFVQAGRGLAAAHGLGVIHRDFKPSNVVVTPEGSAKVIDFGLARAAEASGSSHGQAVLSHEGSSMAPPGADLLQTRLTVDGTVMGTPAYMAPEQLRGAACDAKSDQFSFCVALYEALWNRRPFADDAVDSGAILPPNDATVPHRLFGIVRRGLSAQPEQRWPSVESLLGALEHVRRGRRRWWLGATLLTTTVVAAAWLWPRDPRCEDLAAGFSEAWNPARRQQLQHAFEATGSAYATDAAKRVIEQLDARAADWKRVRTQSCTEHRDGALSATAFDRRIACLDDLEDEIDALADILVRADSTMVSKAVVTAAQSSSAAACADDEALAIRPHAVDPKTTAAVAELEHRFRRAKALSELGRNDDAGRVATIALERARALGHAPSLAKALLTAGQVAQSRGDYDEAEAQMQEAYWGAKEAGADDTAASAASGLCYVVGDLLARHDEGLEWARHADGHIARLGSGAEDFAIALQVSRGIVHHRKGDLDAARRELEGALTLRMDAHGADDLDVATIRLDLGNVLVEQGQLEDARAQFESTLSTRERILGNEHPLIAPTIASLASVASRQGAYEEAVALGERALALAEKTHGRDHPMFGMALVNLGAALEKLGRVEQAVARYEEALAHLRSSLGPDHPHIAVIRHNLGGALRRLGKLEQAHAHLLAAHADFEAIHGPDDPRVAASHTNLGGLLEAIDEPEKALVHYQRALEITQKHRDANDPAIATSLHNRGNVQRTLGQPERALADHRRAAEIWKAAFGDEHPTYAVGLTGLGSALIEVGETAEASDVLERAWAIVEASGSPPDERAATAFALARALAAAGKRREATRLGRIAVDASETAGATELAERARRWLEARQ